MLDTTGSPSTPRQAAKAAASSQTEASHATWRTRLAPYRAADDRRAIWELISTLLPFALCWVAAALAWRWSPWLAILPMLPAAAILVRLFVIQHDCGHGALFTSRRANDWTGRILGILTLTPYDYWRRSHAIHHATSGNLDRRGIGDIPTLTVAEYRARGPLGRWAYRLLRHPLVLFGIGPFYLFVLQHRLPVAFMRKGFMPWISTMSTNLGIAALWGAAIYAMGWQAFLFLALPMIAIAASAGVWLFYVQHQFGQTHWARTADWSDEDAAFKGSSFYDMPAPLRWATGNIGIHHVHHMSSRIPFYRLGQVLKDFPNLRLVGRLTVRESLKCARLKLWDEHACRLVPFKAAGT